MKWFRRLDTQLYVVVASVVTLWFASFAVSFHFWEKERAQQILALEQERVGARLAAETSRILNDILLNHDAAIELTLAQIRRDLKLSSIHLRREKAPAIEQGAEEPASAPGSVRVETPVEFDGRHFGQIIATKRVSGAQGTGWESGLSILGAAAAMFLLFWIIRSFVKHRIVHPIQNLINSLGYPEAAGLAAQDGAKSQELAELTASFALMRKELGEYQTKVISAERDQTRVEIASQVAHDIRSPLAALLSVHEDLGELPESKRLLVRSAIGRIQDIANSLLEKCNNLTTNPIQEGEETDTVCLLSSLVDNIVSEKRAQHRSRLNVTIEAALEAESYGVFSRVQPREFKRALSNLIDNAVDAIDTAGAVRVKISASASTASVVISDNGRGIPSEILEKIGHRGFSFGKAHGNGLGFAQAKSVAEKANGRICISSRVGIGTEVCFSLPRSPEPAWFVPCLLPTPNTVVVILDDDASIHHIWRKRFSSTPNQVGVELFSFTRGSDLISWWEVQDPATKRRCLYLTDFELLGEAASGIEVMKQIKATGRAVLVTSRFDDPKVLSAADSAGMRIIPKGMAGFVPLRFDSTNATNWDFILIDDDPVVRLSWELSAKAHDLQGIVVSKPADFFAQQIEVARTTPVYVDQELGGELKGTSVALEIKKLGFTTVYLATGLAGIKSSTDAFSGIACVGKQPPWAAAVGPNA